MELYQWIEKKKRNLFDWVNSAKFGRNVIDWADRSKQIGGARETMPFVPINKQCRDKVCVRISLKKVSFCGEGLFRKDFVKKMMH